MKNYLTLTSRKLRTNPTEAEKRLWYQLSRNNLGIKFRRQEIIGNYIVDFVTYSIRLIIEVDGGQHSDSESDKIRDSWLISQGFKVLRFWNNEVLENVEGVLGKIMDELNTTPSPTLPTRGRELKGKSIPTRGRELKGKSIPTRRREQIQETTLSEESIPSPGMGRVGERIHYSGTVIKGDQQGRKYGFPTANIGVDHGLLPGIYAGAVDLDNKTYKAAIIVNPNKEDRVLEAYLIDFSRDIYGKEITILVKQRLRDWIVFKSAEQATEQIKADINLILNS